MGLRGSSFVVLVAAVATLLLTTGFSSAHANESPSADASQKAARRRQAVRKDLQTFRSVVDVIWLRKVVRDIEIPRRNAPLAAAPIGLFSASPSDLPAPTARQTFAVSSLGAPPAPAIPVDMDELETVEHQPASERAPFATVAQAQTRLAAARWSRLASSAGNGLTEGAHLLGRAASDRTLLELRAAAIHTLADWSAHRALAYRYEAQAAELRDSLSDAGQALAARLADASFERAPVEAPAIAADVAKPARLTAPRLAALPAPETVVERPAVAPLAPGREAAQATPAPAASAAPTLRSLAAILSQAADALDAASASLAQLADSRDAISMTASLPDPPSIDQ